MRTGAYYAAIMENRVDFEGKTVMDVGAGSGILSLFAAQVRQATMLQLNMLHSKHCIPSVRMDAGGCKQSPCSGSIQDGRLCSSPGRCKSRYQQALN